MALRSVTFGLDLKHLSHPAVKFILSITLRIQHLSTMGTCSYRPGCC